MYYWNYLRVTFYLSKNVANGLRNEVTNQFLSELILQKFCNFLKSHIVMICSSKRVDCTKQHYDIME